MKFEFDDDIDFTIPENVKINKRAKAQPKKTEKEREAIKKVKYDEIITKKVESFTEIVGIELKKNVQYRIITNKSFNAVSVLKHIIEKHKIIEMYIVVYRMNNLAFNMIKEIIEIDNIPTGFIISVFFRNNKKYEAWVSQLKYMNQNKRNIKLAFINSHAKVFLAKTEDQKHYVFEGSGNLSHNERIEQYIYEDNKEVYEFHKNWIEREFI